MQKKCLWNHKEGPKGGCQRLYDPVGPGVWGYLRQNSGMNSTITANSSRRPMSMATVQTQV